MIDDSRAVLRGVIEDFFEETSGFPVGILLTNGWFGRPWDNYYTLKSISFSGIREMVISFEEGYHITFVAESFSHIVRVEERSVDLNIEIESGTMESPPNRSINLGAGSIAFRAGLGPKNSDEVQSGEWIQLFSDKIARISKTALISRWG